MTADRRIVRDADQVARLVMLTANASGMKARDAAYRLRFYLDKLPPEDRIVGLDAVADMLAEMHRWKDAWASEHVDKDRQVRAAMARSASCDAHGEQIRGLADQLTAVGEARGRAESGRLVMLAWYQQCVDFARIARENQKIGKALPAVEDILAWMERQLPKVHAAHQRVWSSKRKYERKAADA